MSTTYEALTYDSATATATPSSFAAQAIDGVLVPRLSSPPLRKVTGTVYGLTAVAYTQDQYMGTGAIEFADCTPDNGGSGFIHQVKLTISPDPTLVGMVTLALFDASKTVANTAALSLTYAADRDDLVALVPLDLAWSLGDFTVFQANNLKIPFVTGTGTKNLYGILYCEQPTTLTGSPAARVDLVVSHL